MKISDLKPAPGATKKRKRVGCGPGSGHGKTSTRGHKGQKSRSGYSRKPGYEGGQMPLTRRVPKRGFTNIHSEPYEIVNIKKLAAFEANSEVTPDSMKAKGIIKGGKKIKILGQGELTIPLVVKAHKFSKSALDKIIGAKGKTERIK
ncbi:50S ribosomal protein L15 [candidate division WOR-3 bacterium RBG_13_43_14]|uniref:Large ribosomal subunit protein uL15 n=1 Tax=candidate division WOR-3 bacterium RBG_13_43_14 TaxID=1802590 RepID=A0A1F4UC71_UNCW3|nr:MAG: 50S ribosomal protein L15 [candidate division WOR-3 bacterium RBG_13_43_14]